MGPLKKHRIQEEQQSQQQAQQQVPATTA